jgi:hypothetical protein
MRDPGNDDLDARGDDSTLSRRVPPGRKQVSPERLLELLNQRLAAYGHCHNCRFAGPIRRLDEPRPDGRNWSRYIPLTCGSQTAGGCARVANRIIDDATLEYNLSEGAR